MEEDRKKIDRLTEEYLSASDAYLAEMKKVH
jgi:hypothetical protein